MADLLLSPLAWLLFAMVLALLARGAPGGRLVRAAALSLGLLSMAMMTPLVANGLIGLLEFDADPACAKLPPATIVVLAGGVDRRPDDASDFSVLNGASRRRMDTAIQAWRQAPQSRLLLSGAASRRGSGAVPLAQLMAAYARWHGVPAAALMQEPGSENTWQSAQATAALAPPGPLALVSSASHLRRARLAFDAAGVPACLLPSDPRRLYVGFPWALLPRVSALEKSEDALHEFAGLLYYRWLAWRQPDQ